MRGGAAAVVAIKLQTRPSVGDVVTLPGGKRIRIRSVGVPYIQPPPAVCDDPLCPWHGHLKIKLKLMEVTVEKVKMQKAAVAVREWVHYIPKYKRYERRRRRIHVRVPECIEVKPGDKVIIAETRPLAKTIAWVVIGKSKDVMPWRAAREALEGTHTPAPFNPSFEIPGPS
jgi:small subunit ribosomal protein S17